MADIPTIGANNEGHSQNPKLSKLSFLKKPLINLISGLAITLVTMLIIGNVSLLWSGPEVYRIYIVGNEKETVIRDIMTAFKEEFDSKQPLKIDGKEIEVQIENDYGDAEYAKSIAGTLASKDDILMLVGHFSSSVTKKALPEYLRKEPPIPVILTTETNPELYPIKSQAMNEKAIPVIRLWPTDENQAENIADYAMDKMKEENSALFWVVEDKWDNNTYSHYLAEKIIQHLQEQQKEVILWSTNQSIPPLNTLRGLNIGCIFFPGKWSNALILIRQVRAIWKQDSTHDYKGPAIFLTDFSVDPRLIEQGGEDVEGVFLTHPLNACAYSNDGHKRYGTDGAKIARALISDAKARFEHVISFSWLRRLFNYHNIKDARTSVIDAMEEAKQQRKKYNGSGNEEYTFDENGNRINASFYLWTIKNGKFVDPAGPCPD
jgi:ABC-type branched-subunit amino acid transport system substrate-binding protein